MPAPQICNSETAPKQGVLTSTTDAGGCKCGDAGAVKNRCLNHFGYKRSQQLWSLFPIDPKLPIARSLATQFVLQEFIRLCEKPSTLDKLCFYCENLLKANQENDSKILSILDEMRHSITMTTLRKFFKAFSPLLNNSDENVLVYLLENKKKLNSHLGSKSIETLLQSFFPAGVSQLRDVIYEGYNRRGFNTFFDKVEPLINALEW
jgi:hypothetical protein